MKNKQNSIEHNGVKTINTNTVLSKEQFKEFTTFLNIIKPHFKDFCIVNGHFRSRSNDNTSIVETGFSYFRNLDFNITDTKLLVKMLSTLDKKVEITITINDTNITFSDSYQSLKIEKAYHEFINNKFIAEEELKEVISKIDTDKPFIKETLPKNIVCNINKMVRDLNANQSVGYGISSNAERREHKIKFRKDFLAPMNKNHCCNVSVLPFIFNKTDMNFNWYISRDEFIIFTIYNTRVDELIIHICGRTSIVEMEELE